jgi:16S rRNA processing protein RimM
LISDAQPELRIGRLTKPHGVKGALRLELLTDFPDRFQPGNVVQVDGRRLTILSSEERDGGLVVSFAGVATRDAAQALAGRYCTLPLVEARALPADHFYHFQLVGLSVFDQRRECELGRVEEVLSYAANDVLRVASGNSELLIPMVKGIIRSVRPAEGVITVELPEETEA